MTRLAVACAALLIISSAACAPVGQREVEIVLRHSHFEPATVTVADGIPVTFVLKNVDPIDHEWILGDAALHERHRIGTEPVHDSRPNEVTVPAQGERRTTLTFAVPTTLTFICHLPGHERYGMVGSLTIR